MIVIGVQSSIQYTLIQTYRNQASPVEKCAITYLINYYFYIFYIHYTHWNHQNAVFSVQMIFKNVTEAFKGNINRMNDRENILAV